MDNDLAVLNPTKRFSNRVENYVKYRPHYPPEILPFFETAFGLKKDQRIADIGSGTGLFAEILLREGYSVTCIEPNEEMRKAGKNNLKIYAGFSSRKGQAEHSGLRKCSIDLITVAQAFHWMEPVATKKEFHRILKPGGHIVLAWNIRLKHTPFLQEYEKLKIRFGINYKPNSGLSVEALKDFVQPCAMESLSLPNIQWLHFDGLKGHLLSASYIPLPGHNFYDAMIAALVEIFAAYNENGFVKMEYETKLFWNSI